MFSPLLSGSFFFANGANQGPALNLVFYGLQLHVWEVFVGPPKWRYYWLCLYYISNIFPMAVDDDG